MKSEWHNARLADGPTVSRWVAERLPVMTEVLRDDPFASVIRGWNRLDRLVSVAVLDEWLTPVGIHLSELPAGCWRWSSPKMHLRLRPTCEEIVDQWTKGRGRDELSRAYGVDRRVVSRWIRGIPGGPAVREERAA